MSIYVNQAVAEMRGIPLSQLSAEQRRILKEDSKRREKLIKETMRQVLESNQVAFDNVLVMEQYLANMYQQVGNDLINKVNALRMEVEKNGGEWDIKSMGKHQRMENLLVQINEEIRALGEVEVAFYEKNLSNVYQDQYIRELYALSKSMPVNISMDSISPALIRQVINYPYDGAMFSDRIWDNKALLLRNLKQGLTKSMILGESMGKVASRLTDEISTARFNAMRIARTEVMRVSYLAEKKAMEEHEINRVMYWATIPSERTCPKCGKLHKNEYKMGDEPYLPIHPQCRCTYVPIIEEFAYGYEAPEQSYQEFKEEIVEPVVEQPKERKKRKTYSHHIFKKDYFDIKDEAVSFDGDEVEVDILGDKMNIRSTESIEWLKKLKKVKSRDEFNKLYEDAEFSDTFDVYTSRMFAMYNDKYKMRDDLFDVDGYKLGVSKAEGMDIGDKNLNSKPLEESERLAVERYTGSWSSPMNSHLRGYSNMADDDDIMFAIERLDDAIDKSVLKKDTLLNRGASYDIFSEDLLEMVYNNPSDVVGYTIKDLGYMSTSTCIAGRFEADISMMIKAPKGTKGLWVEPMTTSRGEMEVILPRGTKLEILEAKLNEDNGKLHLLMEVVNE